jgi:hypothetical protein
VPNPDTRAMIRPETAGLTDARAGCPAGRLKLP